VSAKTVRLWMLDVIVVFRSGGIAGVRT
jgi:hypothetical protein